MWNNIRTFKTRNFRVTLDWAEEEFPNLSWDETGETQAKVESGEWGVYTFRVAVFYRGEEVGRDYLGDSIYADPEEFGREHIGTGPKSRECGMSPGSYFSDMIGEAIREARRNLTAKRPYIRAAGP